MTVVAIIQARLNSTRLPGKVLMDIACKPMIDHVIERAQAIKGVDRVVLNIPLGDSALDRPDITYEVADQEKDVLGSFSKIAMLEQADVVVRLTGDCPLLDPELCAETLRLYQACSHYQHSMDLFCINDTMRSGYPDGTDCEVFSTKALRRAAEKAVSAFDREHVTPWLRRHLPIYGILTPPGVDLSKRKWSVDTQEDLERVQRINRHLKRGSFGWLSTVLAEDST